MPTLNNPKHEKFCHLRAGGKSATEAYIAAGYSERGAGQSAHRMLKNAEIKARIFELQTDVADRVIARTAINESYVTEGLMRIAQLCGNPASPSWKPSASLRALELLGKSLGMFVERRETWTVNDFSTREELESEYDRLTKKIDELKAAEAKGADEDAGSAARNYTRKSAYGSAHARAARKGDKDPDTLH